MGDWFENGLRFQCTRCGNCCSRTAGVSGEVRVDAREIERLAARLELTVDAFRAIYTRRLDDGATSLRETPDGDCRLLDRDRGCLAYADRPRQCRTWPFWRSVVASDERWRRAAATCPGIDTGPLHDADTIRATLTDDGTSGRLDG